jgi:hypothetical protein
MDTKRIIRFNRTLEEEFLQIGHYIDDPEILNPLLTEWLVEYNFKRPHESLKKYLLTSFFSTKKCYLCPQCVQYLDILDFLVYYQISNNPVKKGESVC